MRYKQYLIESTTKKTTLYHEICTGIFTKQPNADITYGKDIKKYIDNRTIAPAVTTQSRDVISISYDKLSDQQKELLETDDPIPTNLINDATKLAKSIRNVIGIPDANKSVYWTGPTNDSSKYGAADITYIKNSVVQPISLKYGKGQLKNLTLNTFGDIILSGIIPDNETFGKILFSGYNSIVWDSLTKEWVNLFSSNIPELSDVLHKYSSLTWDEYQKSVMSDEEIEFIKDTTNIKIKTNKLKDILRKLYDNNIKDQWRNIKSKHFDHLFNTYFTNNKDKMKKNLFKVFVKQMSVSKDTDMWYAANGGKKIIFIPNSDSFNRIGSFLNFDVESKSSGGSYTVTLTVGIGDNNIILIKIKMNIRWATGQMNGKPSVKSSMNNTFDPDAWNKIFKS